MSELLQWTSLLSESIFFVDQFEVNLDDMIRAGIPGAIVRVNGNPRDHIFVHVRQNDEFLGCVAGMISEDA